MKIKYDFVTNSSSSAFIVQTSDVESVTKTMIETIKYHPLYKDKRRWKSLNKYLRNLKLLNEYKRLKVENIYIENFFGESLYIIKDEWFDIYVSATHHVPWNDIFSGSYCHQGFDDDIYERLHKESLKFLDLEDGCIKKYNHETYRMEPFYETKNRLRNK